MVLQSLWWTMFGCMSQLFGHIMSPKSLNMAYCTYGLNPFFSSSEMTKCAVSTFVVKYLFYGILYPYSVRHNIRTIQPIFMKFWQELKQLINLVLDVFLLIANSKHACTESEKGDFFQKARFVPFYPYM